MTIHTRAYSGKKYRKRLEFNVAERTLFRSVEEQAQTKADGKRRWYVAGAMLYCSTVCIQLIVTDQERRYPGRTTQQQGKVADDKVGFALDINNVS